MVNRIFCAALFSLFIGYQLGFGAVVELPTQPSTTSCSAGFSTAAETKSSHKNGGFVGFLKRQSKVRKSLILAMALSAPVISRVNDIAQNTKLFPWMAIQLENLRMTKIQKLAAVLREDTHGLPNE